MQPSLALNLAPPRTRLAYLGEEAACVLLGAALTFVLFFALARFENPRAPEPEAPIEDLRTVSSVVEPPPPRPELQPQLPDTMVPLTGIEIAPAAESPVKLAVVPPDLAHLMPTTELPPKATVHFGELLTDLKPHPGAYGDLQHIYQQSEVDQVPVAVVKTIARVPSRYHDNTDQLRVTLVLVIEPSGEISSIKVIRPSANPKFDAIVVDCVQHEWQFSAATRKGHQVRCMVQQLVWYKWSTGDIFTL